VVLPQGAPSTPIIVELRMCKAPKVNEEVEVVLEIRAFEDAPGTTAHIELPPEARLLGGHLHWEGQVKPGSPVQLTIRIAFTEEGEYAIEGKALRPVTEGMVWGDADYVYLTVKRDTGFFGFESGDESQLTTTPAQRKSD
jgi:hypothetical protein